MGLVQTNGLATSVAVENHLLFDIPSSWSLEDAATVPVVYCTAYYALVVRGQLRRGETVLIHSGSGGVGQAAIAIALSYGCRVFTTCGMDCSKIMDLIFFIYYYYFFFLGVGRVVIAVGDFRNVFKFHAYSVNKRS